jgi:hypothetical protein
MRVDRTIRELDYVNIEFGTYPGILFGMRTYEEQWKTSTVLYIPFLDMCIKKVYKSKYKNGPGQ